MSASEASLAPSPPITPWVGPLVRSLLGGDSQELLEPLRWQHLPPGQDFEGSSLPAPQAVLPRRERLAGSLRTFNQEMGHPLARSLSELLADAGTEVVVTGQQAGLFGGPIYAVSKAIAATLWARRLSAAGRPAVAVFWIASEDHDFEEVRSACLGQSAVAVGHGSRETRPVGERLVDAQMLREIERAASDCVSALSAPPELEQALELATSCYVRGQPFSSGFARLLPALLGDACPLLLDSRDLALKAMQVEPVQELIRQAPAAVQVLEERQKAIEAEGFKLQIGSARQPDGRYALPLFLHREGCRYRVILDRPESANSTYSLRGYEESGSQEELLAVIEKSPAQMSPSALLRVVLQDAALGTTLQVLGPGELAYVPQAAPLYGLLGVSPSTVALRPQAVFLPSRVHRHYRAILAAEALSPAQILGAWSDLERVLAARGDNGTLGALDALRSQLAEGLSGISARAVALDKSLEQAMGKTRQHLERGLDRFRARVEKAAAAEAGVVRGRIDRIRSIALPDGKLQERKLCSLWLRAQFGSGAMDQIAERLSLDPRALQVLMVDRTP